MAPPDKWLAQLAARRNLGETHSCSSSGPPGAPHAFGAPHCRASLQRAWTGHWGTQSEAASAATPEALGCLGLAALLGQSVLGPPSALVPPSALGPLSGLRLERLCVGLLPAGAGATRQLGQPWLKRQVGSSSNIEDTTLLTSNHFSFMSMQQNMSGVAKSMSCKIGADFPHRWLLLCMCALLQISETAFV